MVEFVEMRGKGAWPSTLRPKLINHRFFRSVSTVFVVVVTFSVSTNDNKSGANALH